MRSCVINIVDLLSEVCEVSIGSRLAKERRPDGGWRTGGGKEESEYGKCKREVGSRECANMPSREPIVFLLHLPPKCRDRAYQFALYSRPHPLRTFPRLHVSFAVVSYICILRGFILGHAPITKAMSSAGKQEFDELGRRFESSETSVLIDELSPL